MTRNSGFLQVNKLDLSRKVKRLTAQGQGTTGLMGCGTSRGTPAVYEPQLAQLEGRAVTQSVKDCPGHSGDRIFAAGHSGDRIFAAPCATPHNNEPLVAISESDTKCGDLWHATQTQSSDQCSSVVSVAETAPNAASNASNTTSSEDANAVEWPESDGALVPGESSAANSKCHSWPREGGCGVQPVQQAHLLQFFGRQALDGAPPMPAQVKAEEEEQAANPPSIRPRSGPENFCSWRCDANQGIPVCLASRLGMGLLRRQSKHDVFQIRLEDLRSSADADNRLKDIQRLLRSMPSSPLHGADACVHDAFVRSEGGWSKPPLSGAHDVASPRACAPPSNSEPQMVQIHSPTNSAGHEDGLARDAASINSAECETACKQSLLAAPQHSISSIAVGGVTSGGG
jgi:hypothetical protein